MNAATPNVKSAVPDTNERNRPYTTLMRSYIKALNSTNMLSLLGVYPSFIRP